MLEGGGLETKTPWKRGRGGRQLRTNLRNDSKYAGLFCCREKGAFGLGGLQSGKNLLCRGGEEGRAIQKDAMNIPLARGLNHQGVAGGRETHAFDQRGRERESN